MRISPLNTRAPLKITKILIDITKIPSVIQKILADTQQVYIKVLLWNPNEIGNQRNLKGFYKNSDSEFQCIIPQFTEIPSKSH